MQLCVSGVGWSCRNSAGACAQNNMTGLTTAATAHLRSPTPAPPYASLMPASAAEAALELWAMPRKLPCQFRQLFVHRPVLIAATYNKMSVCLLLRGCRTAWRLIMGCKHVTGCVCDLQTTFLHATPLTSSSSVFLIVIGSIREGKGTGLLAEPHAPSRPFRHDGARMGRRRGKLNHSGCSAPLHRRLRLPPLLTDHQAGLG